MSCFVATDGAHRDDVLVFFQAKTDVYNPIYFFDGKGTVDKKAWRVQQVSFFL